MIAIFSKKVEEFFIFVNSRNASQSNQIIIEFVVIALDHETENAAIECLRG